MNAVRNLTYLGSRTNTAGGLEAADTRVLQQRAGDRPDVDNVVVLITDGKPNERMDDTVPVARQLRSRGARIIAVGVTNNTNMVELREIASRPEDVFAVEDFSSLEANILEIVEAGCRERPGRAVKEMLLNVI